MPGFLIKRGPLEECDEIVEEIEAERRDDRIGRTISHLQQAHSYLGDDQREEGDHDTEADRAASPRFSRNRISIRAFRCPPNPTYPRPRSARRSSRTSNPPRQTGRTSGHPRSIERRNCANKIDEPTAGREEGSRIEADDLEHRPGSDDCDRSKRHGAGTHQAEEEIAREESRYGQPRRARAAEGEARRRR